MRALRLDFYSRIDSDLRAFASLFSFCFCTSNAPKIDEALVGVLILAPTFLPVDVAAGKVARREVKRVSSSNCVHMRFTFTLYYFMLPLLLPLLLLQRTRKCAV